MDWGGDGGQMEAALAAIYIELFIWLSYKKIIYGN